MPSDAAALADSYVELALAGETNRALALLLEPVAGVELTLAALYDDVLAHAARRIGDLWHEGSITVADEHFVTRLTLAAMRDAVRLGVAHAPTGRRIVLACTAEEDHELPLRMVADVLRELGDDVRLLGARTPARDLVAYVLAAEPAALGLSISTALSIPSLSEAVDAVREAAPGLPIVVGGQCVSFYPAVGGAVGADAVCTHLAELPAVLDRLLES